MKTPEEIKMVLEGCSGTHCMRDCPYGDTIACVMMLHKDAQDYIQQLEKELGVTIKEDDDA